ncbi:hypothetical protein CRENBAI_005713 [Crenichthys baileyi]|uniref:C-type lectin domain-containing protein n=1 Tax=Crenichthys baileyi TaxID=28760 RepID=A0AAV9RBD0_9TELE
MAKYKVNVQQFVSSEYLYIKEENNWTEAQQYCREKHAGLATVSNMTDMKRLLNISAGGVKDAWISLDHCHDLVTITNHDEQRSVKQKAQFATTHFVWMGLHYACTLDLWFWVSDKVVSYKNWASDGLMDDCDISGAMEKGRKHQWFKRNYVERFNFIRSRKRQGK